MLAAQQPPPVQPPPGGAGKAPPGAAGQNPPGAGQQPQPSIQPGQLAQPPSPITLDLTGALQRARDYSQQFLSSQVAVQTAHEDVRQARAARYPTLNALNQYIYTQGNGTPSGVFVANDGVHVYNEQAVVHQELFSYTRRAEYRRALAAEALARAKQEVAARGIIGTVVQSYFGLITAQRHLVNAQTSLDEAQRFVDITTKQERGGEAAHADVIKAQIQAQQRQRDVSEAQLAVDKAKVALGVLLFSDLAQEYTVGDDLQTVAELPPLNQLQAQALARSPDLRAAQAALQTSEYGINVARGAYFPSLVIDYFFGINANVFGIHGPYGRQNLGSVVQGTVTVPVWSWGTLQSKVKQAELAQRQAQIDLQFTQRTLQSTLNTFYLEAQAARAQLASLRNSVDLAAESLRLTLLRYQAGEATALEVVDAQTTLVQARNAYDDGLARYRVALASLQTLAGII
jgi:outer membrane protein TolC